MKNYYNRRELITHTIICSAMYIIENFISCEALTEEESEQLEQAKLWIEDFNNSIIQRFGDPFKKKVSNFLRDNELKFRTKRVCENDVQSYIDEDILKEIIAENEINCFECEKCDYLNCKTYKLKVAFDQEGNGKEKGCPFAF